VPEAIGAAEAVGGAGFFYTRIPTTEVQKLHLFENAGFRVVDVSITLSAEVDALRLSDASPNVRLARDSDKSAVAAIATQAFDWSRLHLDPLISRATADRSRREWVTNFFSGDRGDALVVAEREGTPGAFLLLLGPSDGTLTIDLIATDSKFRRCGLGAACIAFAIRAFANVKKMSVGTQAANVPSIRFYESLGFRAASTAYVLHLHRR
jgi:ribosomal protein S18 acetylase RimI-like enzyme